MSRYNVPPDVQESIRDVLDKRVKISIKRMVRMEVKANRMDNKILALSPCRLFLLTAKSPTKLEQSFHFLDLQSIESKKANQMTLTIDGKAYNFSSIEAVSDEMDHIIIHISISLKQIFPAFPIERLVMKIDVQPPERMKTIQEMVRNIAGKETGPCGGFTTMYQCMCDYYSLPFREEVAWDVDTIYLSHDSRELRLQDFDHLNGKDLVPIIGALEHNVWFKCLNASNVKLSPEACSEILKVLRRNAILEEVNLSNTGIRTEFVNKLATAIISNGGTQLSILDLSNNVLDDKGIGHLLGAIKLLPCGLSYFDISHTGLTTRCLNKVGEILSQAPNVVATLTTLKMNDNGLKGEDFPMLYKYIAQPNSISYLDLSSTDCALDTLCDPLLRGCLNLSTLKVSRTVFSHKRNKDVVVPQSWKQLFASACCLEHLDVSGCKLPVEALKEMMLGLSSNRNLKGLHLDLNSNELGPAGASMLASCMAVMPGMSSLDISNNGFDSDLRSLLSELTKNSTLTHLSIGRNFNNIKPKHMPDVMNALVLYIQEDGSVLKYLSLADSKLKSDTTYIINALGSNTSLQEIDLSGNLIGDIGARMLAKALLINNKLQKVVWDRNSVSVQGFEDVAEALKKNMTLKKMPFPVNDAAGALRLFPDRTEVALQKIESFLQRNNNPHRFAPDQAYRLQQGFLISSTQQMVDRLIVQVQDTINAQRSLGVSEADTAPLESAENLLEDANKSRQILPGLQDIALSSQAPGNPVDIELQTMADRLRQVIVEQMKKTSEEMLKCTSTLCPTIMSNQTFQSSLENGCQSKYLLPKDFTNGVLEGPSADIYNLSGEINLSMAALISDSVVEEVIDSLSATHKNLTTQMNRLKSGNLQDKTNAERKEDMEEDRLKVSAESSPKFVSKRKSLLSRKTRPQSAIGEEALHLGARSTNGDMSLHKLEERSTESTPLGSTEKLNDFGDLPTEVSRPLDHVTKARPRREKTHRPTRPVMATGTTEMEVESDVMNSGPAQVPSISLPASERHEPAAPATSKDKEDNSTSHKLEKLDVPAQTVVKQEETSTKSEGKKWSPMSLIKGKTKEEKQEKDRDAKKSTSFSTTFSNKFFKKKDDKRRPSGSEVTPAKSDVEASAEKVTGGAVDTQEESKSNTKGGQDSEKKKDFDKSLEIVKEPVTKDAEETVSTEASLELEDKPPPTPKTPKEKFVLDRPALLPPSRKPEPKAPTLATEEDTTLGEEKKVGPEKAQAEPEDESKEKQETVPKLPAGVAKMGGLGALGGKNLLQEMKLKQGKRFSQRLPSPSEEEKQLPGDPLAAAETNNNVSDTKKDTKKAVLPQKPAIPQVENKEDLNGSTPESSANVAKPPPSPTSSKGPAPAPRALLPPKRPVSTVEDRNPPEIPKSMTMSTPEVSLNDSSSSSVKSSGPVAKPRPPPPIKPRPPIVPRTRKSDSIPADHEVTSADSAVASPSPSASSPKASAPPTEKSSETDKSKEETNNEVFEKGIAQPASAPPDAGIVYDSATLRLSVKDKIKRLSLAKTADESVASSVPPSVQLSKQKAFSLPRDAKLPESSPAELDNDKPKKPKKTSMKDLSQEETFAIEEEDDSSIEDLSSHQTLPAQPPDDEIMV